MGRKRKEVKPQGAVELLYANRYKLVLFAILVFGAYLNLAFFYGPSWMNGSDNYIYTSQAYLLSQGHANLLNCGIVDCVNYIVVAGIASSFALFGYSVLSASFFGIACYALTLVLIYLIAKRLYSSKAGLLAAFFYSIFPLVLSQSSNVGDDIPMVLLVTAAVYLVILALQNKEKRSKYLLLAGFVSAINILSVSEAVIGLFFIASFIILIAIVKMDKKIVRSFAFYIIGVIIAFAVIAAIGMYETGSPIYVLHVYNANYNTFTEAPAFQAYVNNLMPPFKDPNTFNTIAYGYLGYLFIACGIYFLAIRFKKVSILGYWFVFSFLYLGFGTQSITRYIPIMYVGPRYALIFVPAMVLIIGIALAHMIDKGKTLPITQKALLACGLTVVVVFISVSSVMDVVNIQYSQLYASEPLIQIGHYLNALPSNTMMYGPVDIPWSVYLYNQSRPMAAVGYGSYQTSCSEVTNSFALPPGAIVIGNISDHSSCNLNAVYTPTTPDWLNKYTLFQNWGTSFYGYNVYGYNPLNST